MRLGRERKEVLVEEVFLLLRHSDAVERAKDIADGRNTEQSTVGLSSP